MNFLDSAGITICITLLCILASVHSFDFCGESFNKSVCEKTAGVHFACNLDKEPSNGELIAVCPMTHKITSYMVYIHNAKRNLMGNAAETLNSVEKFPKSGAIPLVVWDNELEYLSRLVVKSCITESTSCHNTNNFPNIGYSIGVFGNNERMSILAALDEMTMEWWNEKDRLSGISVVDSLTDAALKTSSRFLQMVYAQTTKFGCAMSVCKDVTTSTGKFKYGYMYSCHYDNVIEVGKRLYEGLAKFQTKHCMRDFGRNRSVLWVNLCASPHDKKRNRTIAETFGMFGWP